MLSTLRSIVPPVADHPLVSGLSAFADNHRVLTVCSVGVLLYGAWFLKRPRNLPPGPLGYPIVGCLPLFTNEHLKALKDKYGDIICLWLGGNSYSIILNSYEAVKEVYVDSRSTFVDRHVEAMSGLFGIQDTIFNINYDEKCKASRKIFIHRLRAIINSDLGNVLKAELEEIEKYLDVYSGESVDISPFIQRVFTNSMTQVLYGQRHDDKESDHLSEKLHHWNKYFGETSAYALVPRYLSTILLNKPLTLGREVTKDIMKYVQQNVCHHKILEEAELPHDILAAYLQNGHYTDKEVVANLLTLMTDATYISPIMAMWVLIYLTNNPECQQDIYKEVLVVCGNNNIDLSLRSQMPITESFIMEVFRIVTPVSITPPSKPNKTATLRGYTIPDFVSIMKNVEVVHRDANLFPEPDMFKPRRFIKDGKISNIQGFMPFGVGRRICLGEQLVRNNIFYIVARLMQKYKMCPPNGVPLSTEIIDDIFVKIPNKCTLCFTKR